MGNWFGIVGVEMVGAMRMVASVVAVLVSAGLGAVLVGFATSGTGDPVPLAGEPLKRVPRLHLLVASNPPFVLDVGTGRVTPIRAPAVMKRGEAREGSDLCGSHMHTGFASALTRCGSPALAGLPLERCVAG